MKIREIQNYKRRARGLALIQSASCENSAKEIGKRFTKELCQQKQAFKFIYGTGRGQTASALFAAS